MDGITQYLTTDLDLTSPDDPTALAEALGVRGFRLMRRVTRLSESEWFCGFSMEAGDHDEPGPHIAAMLTAIESLEPPLRSAWAECSLRMFDIGYSCGPEPFVVRQDLSAATVARLAAVGGSLRITLYSDREPIPAEPGVVADGEEREVSRIP